MNQINLSALAVVLIFSILNESIIEYFFGTVARVRPYLPLISLAISILITFMYQVNIFTITFGVQTESPFLDFLFSGFIIARVSNYINDLVQKFFGSK